jgi:hypothetical protein
VVSHGRPVVALEPADVALPERGLWSKMPMVAGGIGVAGVAAATLLGMGNATQFFHSWLVAWLWTLSLGLGGLFFVLTAFVTRAGWSVVVRRLAEHVAATLPVLGVLFVPVALGLSELYPWSRPEVVAGDAVLTGKAGWLSSGPFLVRSAGYLLVWAVMGWWLWRQSRRQDGEGGVAVTRRLQTLSAPALVVFGLTLSFASMDWIMSLDPHWYSTIFGVYFFAGSAVAIFAFLVLLALSLQRGGALRGVVSAEHYHDLGKLLFAFTVFWAYIAFSQFMLVWYANIPEETLWFAHRWHHGWEVVSVALAVGHFGLPFFFLMPRGVKRRRATLWLGATWMLAVHYLDLWWLVMPSLHREGPHPHLLDLATLLGVGGLFLATLALLMRRRSLVPVADPRLAESLAFENA